MLFGRQLNRGQLVLYAAPAGLSPPFGGASQASLVNVSRGFNVLWPGLRVVHRSRVRSCSAIQSIADLPLRLRLALLKDQQSANRENRRDDEELLSASGANLVYAGYPYDPFAMPHEPKRAQLITAGYDSAPRVQVGGG